MPFSLFDAQITSVLKQEFCLIKDNPPALVKLIILNLSTVSVRLLKDDSDASLFSFVLTPDTFYSSVAMVNECIPFASDKSSCVSFFFFVSSDIIAFAHANPKFSMKKSVSRFSGLPV